MPVDLPANINQITKRLDAGTWLWRLDITIPGVGDVLRLVNNTENIEYDNNKYYRCPFELGPWSIKGAQIPYRKLMITNVDYTQYLHPYVKDYDGIVDSTVVATPVNIENIALDLSSKAQELQVIQTSVKEKGITLTLGAANPLNSTHPRHKYGAMKCRWLSRFKGHECGYSGEETCDGKYATCVSLSNETRFGAELGLRPKTTRWA